MPLCRGSALVRNVRLLPRRSVHRRPDRQDLAGHARGAPLSGRDRRLIRALSYCVSPESGCGTTRTCRGGPTTSAVGGRTDMPFKRADFLVLMEGSIGQRNTLIFSERWSVDMK